MNSTFIQKFNQRFGKGASMEGIAHQPIIKDRDAKVGIWCLKEVTGSCWQPCRCQRRRRFCLECPQLFSRCGRFPLRSGDDAIMEVWLPRILHVIFLGILEMKLRRVCGFICLGHINRYVCLGCRAHFLLITQVCIERFWPNWLIDFNWFMRIFYANRALQFWVWAQLLSLIIGRIFFKEWPSFLGSICLIS